MRDDLEKVARSTSANVTRSTAPVAGGSGYCMHRHPFSVVIAQYTSMVVSIDKFSVYRSVDIEERRVARHCAAKFNTEIERTRGTNELPSVRHCEIQQRLSTQLTTTKINSYMQTSCSRSNCCAKLRKTKQTTRVTAVSKQSNLFTNVSIGDAVFSLIIQI